MFWDSLFRASPCTLSWHIIPQIHLKSEAESIKIALTIICRKQQPTLNISTKRMSEKVIRLLPSSSHLQQLGVSTWKQALSEADTPYRGMHFQAQSKGLPLLLPASSRWEKQSQSEVILSWYKQSPNKSVFLLSFWHHTPPWSTQLPPYSGSSFSTHYINQINLVSCF